MTDPSRLTASEARLLLVSGKLTAERLVSACIDRIRVRDHEVHAWVHIDAERTLEQARQIDRRGIRGPLGGIPIGIKDVFQTKDMPTQYNSPLFEGNQPGVDAAAVTLLRDAGAIILGKTDTVEFAATGRKARTRNPHDLVRTPGASSSGSAAAVADFHVPMTLGTQTGGSMIRPASFCGTWAMKPTWNSVSNEGARRYSATLDTVGWFARSAEDLALFYHVLTGDEGEIRPEGTFFTFAHLKSSLWDRAEAAARQMMERVVAGLPLLGHRVVDVELPHELSDLAALHMRIMRGEGRVAFLPEYRIGRDLLDPSIREQVENVDGITPAQLLEAQDIAAEARRTFDAVMRDFDAVIAPSTLGVAPIGLANTGDLIFNGFWTMLHVPCINVPFRDQETGLPVGLTLAAARGADAKVLSAAHAFQTIS